jgi:hypothetical protein
MHYRPGSTSPFTTGGSLDPQYSASVPLMIPVTEQSTGILYRHRQTFNNTSVPNFAYRAALSYVTGTHNFKAGWNMVHGYLNVRTYNYQPVAYRFNNGIPNQLTQYATPYTLQADQDADMGFFAQDRWSLDRWTLTLGIRYDQFNTSFPEQVIGPSLLDPNRNLTFPAQDNLNWKDVTWRSGFSYDLFGNGKTAIKGAINKYLLGQTLNGIGSSPNPIGSLVTSANRSWTDDGRNGGIAGDFVPQCNLTAVAANGECGALSNANFGTTVPGDTYDPGMLRGWGVRPWNIEFTASVQH